MIRRMFGGRRHDEPEKKTFARRDYSALLKDMLRPWGIHQVADNRFRSCCPIHRGDNPTAFSVTKEGLWTCFRGCGSGGMADLLAHARGITKSQALSVLETMPTVFNTLGFFDQQKAPAEKRREAEVRAYEGICPRYLLSRGFSASALRAYGIGYDRQGRRIVIPVRDHRGVLVGITYRADKDASSEVAKYWHDEFIKTNYLWGLWKVPVGSDLYIVEGQLDVVRMWQLGHHAAAVMGSSISSAQVSLLINAAKPRRLILAYDNDEAGDKATNQTLRGLAPTPMGRRLFVAHYPTSDPGELREYHHIEHVPWFKHSHSHLQEKH